MSITEHVSDCLLQSVNFENFRLYNESLPLSPQSTICLPPVINFCSLSSMFVSCSIFRFSDRTDSFAVTDTVQVSPFCRWTNIWNGFLYALSAFVKSTLGFVDPLMDAWQFGHLLLSLCPFRTGLIQSLQKMCSQGFSMRHSSLVKSLQMVHLISDGSTEAMTGIELIQFDKSSSRWVGLTVRWVTGTSVDENWDCTEGQQNAEDETKKLQSTWQSGGHRDSQSLWGTITNLSRCLCAREIFCSLCQHLKTEMTGKGNNLIAY